MSEQKMREALEQIAVLADKYSGEYPTQVGAIAREAIAADRAARAEPIAWATPAGIAAIHAARLGRADNVQVPLSTYPGGDHSVAVYIAPPAAPVVTTEEGRHCGDPDCVPCRDPAEPAAPVVPEGWKPVLEAVMREMPKAARYYRLDDGNAPGHAHKVAGIWDSDNGDLAGKPCAWCLAWNTARAMLAAAPAPSQEPKQ